MRGDARARRWRVVLVGLLGLSLTAVCVSLGLLLPPLRYQATSQVLLLLPTNSRSVRTEVNPFLYQPAGLITLGRVPLPRVRSDDFRQTMLEGGFDARFELDVEVTSPVVLFSVEGPDPADVDETHEELRRRYDDLIREAQTDEGVPARHFAKVLELQSIPAIPVSGDRTRAALVTGAAGVLLTLLMGSWAATGRRVRQGAVPDPVPPQGTVGRAAPRGLRMPAVAFLVVYAGLLLLIPSRLGIAAIGGPGKPASLWALLGLGLWALMTLVGSNHGRSRPIRMATGAFALAAAASYVAGNLVGWYQPADIHQRSDSNWRLVTLPELQQVMISAGDRGLLALAGWLGLVLVTAEGLRSSEDLERLVTWIVRFAGVVAALGLLQYFTGINVAAMIQIPGLSSAVDFTTYTRSILNRVVSTSGHPIEFGVVMGTLLPLALHRSLHTRRPATWIPTVLIGLMVLMSVSRSAVLAAGVALLVLFIGWPARWRLIAVVSAPVLAVVGRALFPGLLGTIQGLFLNIEGDPSVEGRTQDYPFVVRLFSENPVFGKGIYTWATYYYRTLDNQVLVSLLELGAVGLLAFAGLLLTGAVSGIGCRWATKDPRQRHLGLALAAGILGMSLSYFTFDTMGFSQAAGLTYLYVGMAGASWRLARQTPPECPHDAAVELTDRSADRGLVGSGGGTDLRAT